MRRHLALAALVGLLSLPGTRAGAQVLENYDYEDLEFRAIGVDFGWVSPARVRPTSAYGLRLDLGLIGPRVRIVPTARFWASSLRQVEVDRLAEQILLVCDRQADETCPTRLDLGEVQLSDLELSVDAHLLFLAERRVSPYFGVNLGLHLLNGSGDFIDGTFVEDLLDTVAPGIGAVVGTTVRLGAGLQLGAEARVMIGSDVRYGAAALTGSWFLPAPGVDETLGLRRALSQ